MGIGYWIRRFVVVFAIAFAVIAASHLLRDRGLEHALREGLLWATLTAAVFTGTAFHRWRRCRACEAALERGDPPT